MKRVLSDTQIVTISSPAKELQQESDPRSDVYQQVTRLFSPLQTAIYDIISIHPVPNEKETTYIVPDNSTSKMN